MTTGEFARHWIYVSGDVDIDWLADDNNAIRAVNEVVRARARELWENNVRRAAAIWSFGCRRSENCEGATATESW